MAGIENKKVLLAIDGSNESISMVQYVAKMLPPADTRVVLFHVFSKIPESFWDFNQNVELDFWMDKMQALEEEHAKSVKAFMQTARQILLENNFREEHVVTESRNRITGIARDITAESKKGYHAVVMGRKGTGQTNGLAVGSITTKVLRALSALPVCVVTGKPDTERILVALDGSAGSLRAVDFLCSYLNNSSRKVTLFHAMRRLSFPEVSASVANPFEAIEKAVWGDARSTIEPVMEAAKARWIKAGANKKNIATKIVTGVSSRADALATEARETSCGSIVVGRTGISQVEEFNIGRVCHKVIRRAENAAVWVVP